MRIWQQATLSIAVGVIMFLLLLFPSAGAAVVLEFEPARGPVGESVLGASDESGVPLPNSADLKIFLAPSQRAADRARGPRDPRLTGFGILRVDDAGVGRFSGTVPDVAPGAYVAVAYCRSCTAGGSTFTVGEFRVSGPILPATGSSTEGFIRGALVLLTGGLVASLRSRPVWGRRSSSSWAVGWRSHLASDAGDRLEARRRERQG